MNRQPDRDALAVEDDPLMADVVEFEVGNGVENPNFNFPEWYQQYKRLKETDNRDSDEAKAVSFRKMWNHIRLGLPKLRNNPKPSNSYATRQLLELTSNMDMEVVDKIVEEMMCNLQL